MISQILIKVSSPGQRMILRRLAFLYVVVPVSKVVFGAAFFIPALTRLWDLMSTGKYPSMYELDQIGIDAMIVIHFATLIAFLVVSLSIFPRLAENVPYIELNGQTDMIMCVNLTFATISSFLHVMPVVMATENRLSGVDVLTMMGWECFTIVNLVLLVVHLNRMKQKQALVSVCIDDGHTAKY